MNKRITFTKPASKRKYNPDTGEYEGGTAIEVARPCLLQDLGLERSMRIFGDYKQSRKVAILQYPYQEKCDTAKVDGTSYKVVTVKQRGKVWYLERDSIGSNI